MTKRYIIDKADIHDLLAGKPLSLSQSNESAFCVTISGNMTNGDMIKAMFPNINFHDMAFTVHATTNVTSNGVKGGISYDFWKDWWNAPYKAESEDKK